MMPDDDAVAYAEEVYAACATVGFRSPDVDRLKALLDAPKGSETNVLLETAQKVQRDSIGWVGRAR